MKRSPKNDSRAIKAAVPEERRLSAGRVPARTGRFHRTDARRSGCSGGRALSIAGRPLRILIAPCALEPLSRWKTPNVQHRTSNAEVSEDSSCHSMFSVGCSSECVEREGAGGSRGFDLTRIANADILSDMKNFTVRDLDREAGAELGACEREGAAK